MVSRYQKNICYPSITAEFFQQLHKHNVLRPYINNQEPRAGASGAAANGKIFVYGDYFAEMEQRLQLQGRICEMYYEASNEWHFITRNILGCTMGMGVQMTKCFK